MLGTIFCWMMGVGLILFCIDVVAIACAGRNRDQVAKYNREVARGERKEDSSFFPVFLCILLFLVAAATA